jgi:glycosyltransferase involved in cell wall biosynthesis
MPTVRKQIVMRDKRVFSDSESRSNAMVKSTTPLVSVVVIGRNEGERLVECLDSVNRVARDGFRMELIYVDSASSDGSPERARSQGARVIKINPERPSAATGRNAGWRASQGEFVLFLDGDTTLDAGFIRRALDAIREPRVAVVWGHRRERAPGQSIFIRALDLDWVYPPGDSEFCGGDALMRRDALLQVNGFDDSLIAGEEPELCRRMRARDYRILHIDSPMTQHDLGIQSFSAYWRRAVRAGHAYAEVAHRYRDSSDPLWRAESRRNLYKGLLLLSSPALLAVAYTISPGLVLGLSIAAAMTVARTAHRCRWKSSEPTTRWLYAIHSHLQQIPILFGQLAWRLNHRKGQRSRLIEYKQPRSIHSEEASL